jgi:hypothetical protein
MAYSILRFFSDNFKYNSKICSCVFIVFSSRPNIIHFIHIGPDLPHPIWPTDFRWSSAGPVSNFRCVRILEASDPHTWNDNFFCSSNLKKNPGIQWSSAGSIANMKCTQILEAADPHTWTDNYLCVPLNSPLNFLWNSAGPIPGKQCIQWLESSDPHTWTDNYLCGKFWFIVLNFPIRNGPIT